MELFCILLVSLFYTRGPTHHPGSTIWVASLPSLSCLGELHDIVLPFTQISISVGVVSFLGVTLTCYRLECYGCDKNSNKLCVSAEILRKKLAQPVTGVVGGAGGYLQEGHPDLPSTTVSTKRQEQNAHAENTHKCSHIKPRHCLKSESKLAPKGKPTTLFTKGIVYVF